MASGVGRRKQQKTVDGKTQTLFNFFKHSEENVSSTSIVRPIIDDLLRTVVSESERHQSENTPQKRNVRKHTGERVSQKSIESWKRQHPWLIVENDDKGILLKCSTCVEGKVDSLWGAEGSKNVEKNSVDRHGSSNEHKKAERKACCEQVVEVDEQLQCDSPAPVCGEDDIKLFRTVYTVAKEELPTEKVNSLLILQAMNGANIKYKNLSWDTLTEIQACLKDSIQRTLVEEIEQSDYFAIMLDESTDLAVQKHLSVCVRYVKNGKAVTKFLTNIKIPDGKAHTIVRHLIESLDSLSLDKTKMVSMATGGASVMMGHKNGVGVQVKSKISPFATMTHCIAHRLNLAVTDSIKKCDTLKKLREMFNSLYIFMSSSSVRMEKLSALQNVLNEPVLVTKEPHSIRWLGLRNAVAAVFQSYLSVLCTLSYFAGEGNAVANGLFKYFSEYKTILLVALMMDIHDVIAMLSCQLQSNSLVFSEIQPLMDGTISKLDWIVSNDGESMAKMKASIEISDKEATFKGEKLRKYSDSTVQEFLTLREKYISSLKKNIKHRFSREDSDIFKDMSQLLEPSVTNRVTDRECEESLECISEFYGASKKIKVVEGDIIQGFREQVQQIDSLLSGDKLQQEWPVLKGMIAGSYKDLSTEMLCLRVLTVHKNLLPEFCKLCKIALCFCVTSVECERSFSLQNRLKCKYRCSLKPESLDTLITISMCELGVETFDFSKTVRLWLAKKRRRKARLMQPYRPRVACSTTSSCQ